MDENQFEETTPTAAPEVEVPAQDAPEVKPEAQEIEAPEGAEPSEGEPEEKPEPKWKPKGPPDTVPYAEFSKSRAEIRQLREQIEALQTGRPDPVDQPQAPAPAQAIEGLPPKPKAEDFDTYEAYEDAKDEWLQQAGEARAIARINAQTRQEKALETAQKVEDNFEARMQAARTADPEVAQIEDYLLPAAPHLHPAIRQALLAADDPAPLLRHLAESGQSLQEIVQNANSNPIGMIMAFGRYTGKQETAPKQAAPLPIIPPTTTVKSARGLKNETPIDSIAKKSGYEFE